MKQITEEFFYKALFIFWEAPQWRDATKISYHVLSENSGWMCFYSIGKTIRKTNKQTNKKLFRNWKRCTELFQNTFCAIVLALGCAIPEHCWCKCSSCGRSCTTAGMLYASPGYERKKGLDNVSGLFTLNGSMILWLDCNQDSHGYLHLWCRHIRKSTLWSTEDVLTYRRDTVSSQLLFLLINSTVLTKGRWYLASTDKCFGSHSSYSL